MMFTPTPAELALLNGWQDWPIEQAPLLVKKFTEGLNHQCYLVNSNDSLFVLKKSSNPQAIAIHSQQWASHLGIAPSVLFVNDDQTLFLMDYLPHDSNETSPTYLAKSLRTLHSAKYTKKAEQFDLLVTCDQYLRHCDHSLQRTHHHLIPALTLLINDSTPLAYSHNDLVADNCLSQQGSSCLIDWEYARYNNPWFDLASVILYQDFDKYQAKAFLSAYDQRFAERVNKPIFHAASIAVLWLDILWHVSKFGNEHQLKLEKKYQKLHSISAVLNIHINPSLNIS